MIEAHREQVFQRYLVEQRVATSQQKAIEVGLARKSCEHLGLVHAGAHGADHPVASQPVQGSIGSIERLVVVVVRVVDVEDVDSCKAQPFQALLDGAHHAVIAEVEDRVHRWGAAKRLAGLGWRARSQQAPDLAGESELVAGHPPQHLSHAHLREAMAV